MASAASRERQEPRLFELASEEDLREFAATRRTSSSCRSLGVRSA